MVLATFLLRFVSNRAGYFSFLSRSFPSLRSSWYVSAFVYTNIYFFIFYSALLYFLRIYGISSRVHPTRGDPPAWGLGEVVTTLHRKKLRCYEALHKREVQTRLTWLRLMRQ
jgi:hypothetical protein